MDDFSGIHRIQVFFKKIYNAPVLERSFNFCGDFTFLCKSDRVQHAELCFLNDKTTYLATIERHIDKINRDYHHLDDEGFWIGFELKLPYSEIEQIRSYCDDCHNRFEYDLNSLYLICLPALAALIKKEQTHSCASLCFNSLLCSETFVNALNEAHFDMKHIFKIANQPDPNNLYAILKHLAKLKRFSNLVKQINMNYIYNCEEKDYLVKHPRYIDSSDSFFESDDFW